MPQKSKNKTLPSSKTDNQTGVIKKIKEFPTTRFYGSKRRLLPWIYDAIKDIPFTTALDVFGGTASVSLLLKAMGKKVTYNDILLSNKICAHACLLNSLPAPQLEFNMAIDKISPRNGFITKNFKGLYFTEAENQWLDGAIASIGRIQSVNKKAVLYYCVAQACLMKRPFNLFHRANLQLRLAKNIKRSFGNHVTWERPFPELVKRNLEVLARSLWKAAQRAIVLPPQSASKIRAGYDLVYIDPPYVSMNNRDNREHYLRRYHFLEGMAKYSEWHNLIDPSSAIKLFHPSPEIEKWQSKQEFKDILFELITRHKKSVVVLSYVTGAYPSKDVLIKFFKVTFPKVSVHSQRLSHALAKSQRNEILIIGIPH